MNISNQPCILCAAWLPLERPVCRSSLLYFRLTKYAFLDPQVTILLPEGSKLTALACSLTSEKLAFEREFVSHANDSAQAAYLGSLCTFARLTACFYRRMSASPSYLTGQGTGMKHVGSWSLALSSNAPESSPSATCRRSGVLQPTLA